MEQHRVNGHPYHTPQFNIQSLVSLDKGQLKEKDACISKLKEEIQLKEYDRNVYHQQMQSEAKQNLKLKKENEDLKKQIDELKKENEELKKKPEVFTLPTNDNRADAQMPTTKNIEGQPISVGDQVSQKNVPLSRPPAPIQPSTDQRTLADKSLNQIKQFFRDRSPELPEPMVVSDSDEDDAAEESEIQFTPRQSILEKSEKAKLRSRAKAKENAKALMRLALERSEQWKCSTCSYFFATNAALRQHISIHHKDRRICGRCPFTCDKRSSSDVKKHERGHARADVQFKNQAQGRECKLCNVWFGNGRLASHLYRFHLPNDSK